MNNKKTQNSTNQNRNPSSAPPLKPMSEEWWATRKRPERRCKAHLSDGSGQRCRRPALAHQVVCRVHGGASKRAKIAAERRLGEALDRMARQLLGIAESAESEGVRLAAIKHALALGGITERTAVEVEHKIAPYEEILSGIATMSRAESRALRGIESPPTPALELPAALADDDVIDAEVVDDGDASAEIPAERRKRPHARRRRDDDAVGYSAPPRGIGGMMPPEDAMELAAEANRKAGVYPPRRKMRVRR